MVTGFNQLHILDLAYCGLDEWSQVQAFGKLPNLNEIILDGNPLRRVLAPNNETFSNLARFSLASTQITQWSDVDTLGEYPALQVIRLSQVPLFAGRGASEVRPFVIARMANLNTLNGSIVSGRERSDAEKIYLRSIVREKNTAMQQHGRTEEDVERCLAVLHPRYRLLWEKYGADMIMPGTGGAVSGTGMANEMISITFKNLSFGSNGTLEPITKKLPKSLTVSKLRLLVKQLFGLEPRLQQLSIRVYKDSPPTLLDDEMSSLQYFGAIDGAEIFINEDKA